MFGDLNDQEFEVSKALKGAKVIHRIDYEKNEIDTDPNIYFINGNIGETITIANPVMIEDNRYPRDPQYSIAEEGWKKLLVPLITAGDWSLVPDPGGLFLQAADRR